MLIFFFLELGILSFYSLCYLHNRCPSQTFQSALHTSAQQMYNLQDCELVLVSLLSISVLHMPIKYWNEFALS